MCRLAADTTVFTFHEPHRFSRSVAVTTITTTSQQHDAVVQIRPLLYVKLWTVWRLHPGLKQDVLVLRLYVGGE